MLSPQGAQPSASRLDLYSERFRKKLVKSELTPPQITVISFALVILLGAGLLCLPISLTQPDKNSFLTALFTSTSAVCVTGLNVIDPGSFYSLFGQITIMLLIQIGGLGYMTLFSLMVLAVGRKLSLRDRFAMKNMLDLSGPGGVRRFLLRIFRFTLMIELAGTASLMTVWVPQFGWAKGSYYSLFHSISAFNNAGFALFPDNLISYQKHPWLMLVISALIILGGIGYPVLSELWQVFKQRQQKPFRWKYLSLNTRLGLSMTALLLVVGTVLVYLFELANPRTIADLSFGDQILTSFFHAVVPRTAGFNSVDMSALSPATVFINLVLMLIGTNPGGTGGGIKTITVIVLIWQVITILKGEKDTSILKRKLAPSTLSKATAVVFLAMCWINGVTLLLLLSEDKELSILLFETVSAFATVGLSLNFTPQLTATGQILIILTMFVGRVSPLNLVSSLWPQKRKALVKYPEEGLLIG